MITLENKELDIDIANADDYIKIVNLMYETEERLNSIKERKIKVEDGRPTKNSLLEYGQGMKELCNIISDFFDKIGGENTANEIFGEKTTSTKMIQIFNDFGAKLHEQAKTTIKDFSEIYKKAKKWQTNIK